MVMLATSLILLAPARASPRDSIGSTLVSTVQLHGKRVVTRSVCGLATESHDSESQDSKNLNRKRFGLELTKHVGFDLPLPTFGPPLTLTKINLNFR